MNILDYNIDIKMNKEATVTIMTTNIIDYVGLCERLVGINIMNFLNLHYYRIIHKIILKNNGVLDIMVGDQQLSYWKLSHKFKEASLACKCAIEIMNEIITDQNELPDISHFQVSISIVTGNLLIMNNSIIGNIVNIGTRFVSLCKMYGVNILLNEETNKIVNRNFITRTIDEIIIKGNGQSELYELIDFKK